MSVRDLARHLAAHDINHILQIDACFATIDALESWRVCFHFLSTIQPIQSI